MSGFTRNTIICRNKASLLHIGIAVTLIFAPALLYAHNDTLKYDKSKVPTSIVVATEATYSPYCIIDNTGKPTGFSVELMREVGKAVNLEIDFNLGVWNHNRQELMRGHVDALPIVARIPEREAIFDFSNPYLTLSGAIFTKKGNQSIRTFDDIYNKKLLVMQNDHAEDYIHRENLSAQITTAFSFQEAFRMLETGAYDAVICQRVLGLTILKELKIKSIVARDIPLPRFRVDYCFAVTEGNTALLSLLNEGLATVIANNTYNELHLKWFGPQVKQSYSIKDILQISLYLIIPSLIVFGLILILLLRREVRRRTLQLMQEIQEHKKTVQQLDYQYMLFEKVEQVAKIGGWEYNFRNNKIFWTEGTYRIFGISSTSFNPSKLDDNLILFHEEGRKELQEAIKRATEEGIPYDLELKILRPDGKETWVWTSGQADISRGKVSRVYGSIMDITDRKNTAKQLEELNQKLFAIFQASSILQNLQTPKTLATDIISVLEKNLKYENLAVLMLDNESDKLIPFALSSQEKKKNLDKDKRDMALLNIKMGKGITGHVLKTGKTIRLNDVNSDERYIVMRNDIQSEICVPIIVENKVIGVLNAETKVPNAYTQTDEIILETLATQIGIAIHNSHLYQWVQKELEERLAAQTQLTLLNQELDAKVKERTQELSAQIEKLNKSQQAMLYMVEDLNVLTAELKQERQKLQISNKELESFSYSVSHDLRAPLRAINGFSKIILEDYAPKLDAEGNRLFNIIRENSKKMDSLINDLLSLSRITRTEISFMPIDMEKLARQVAADLTSTNDSSALSLNIQRLPLALADPTLMRLVWQNLIGNAIKYSRPQSKQLIEIGGQTEEKQSIYWVKDNGVGFNADYADKLFEPFQRLHKDSEFEGSGIGLSIVKRIVQRHGGKVRAESVPNQGAVFYFSLPQTNDLPPRL
ncbi:MAG: transporter substrate-binding domain-containing protein [Salinivirgaceae bacterium]